MTQTHEHHWIFGDGVHIEFPSGGNPVALSGAALNSIEGCASICDPVTGTLLFYTDGVTVWDAAHAIVATNIGGDQSSFQAAIIVPPAGTGQHYHIFATYAFEQAGGPQDLIHSSYSVVGTSVSQVIAPTPMLGVRVSEHLAAISKPDCSGYWVVTREVESTALHVVSVDGDVPSVLGAQTLPITPGSIAEAGQMKFSPDGQYLAWADVYSGEVVIADFNNATGVITARNRIHSVDYPMGVEFSPNSKFVYFAEHNSCKIFQHDITALPSGAAFDNSTATPAVSGTPGSLEYSALQLAPNGQIYIAGMNRTTLSVITAPDIAAPGHGFVQNALDASSSVLTFPSRSHYALPSFTRILASCSASSSCADLTHQVDAVLADAASGTASRLRHCDGRRPRKPACRDLRLPRIKPHIEVKWGASGCDSIESDDVETLLVTICNPYNNISFSHVSLAKFVLTDASGAPVKLLPNDDPSVEVVPLGAICFGDIAPCSCITRQFVLRTRGAVAGDYHLDMQGLCFDVVLHNDLAACVTFKVCAD